MSSPESSEAQPKNPASLRRIAEVAGVSRMTVSRAFKSGTSVNPELRKRILKIATELGYEPDTMVSELMTSFAGRRPVHYQETIAAFWWPERWHSVQNAHTFEADIHQGLEEGAKLHGRRVDHIVFDKVTPPGVISRMLEARNIQGTILTPPPAAEIQAPDLDWDTLSTVIIGSTLRQPRFHRAQPSHYSAIVHAMDILQSRGFRRPCLLVRTDAEERMQRAYAAAFMAWEVDGMDRIWHAPNPDTPGLSAWLKKKSPDVLIADCDSWLEYIPPAFKSLAFISLAVRDPSGPVSGMHQNTVRMAKCAVDLLVRARLNHELGEPLEPLLMLTAGSWVEGETFTGVSPFSFSPRE